MNWNQSFVSGAALATLMAGCGGEAGTGTPGADFGLGTSSTATTTTTTVPLTPGEAQGVFEGTASNGLYFNTLVLDNDQYYTIYGTLAGGTFDVTGLLTGTGQSSNGGFTSADLKDFPAGGIPLLGTMSASYTPGEIFNEVVSRGGTAVTFPGMAPVNTRYVYNTPANLADISGAWTMTTMAGIPASLNIAADGTYTATSPECNFSGSMMPRASNKNVFDVTVTFGSAPCVLPNQAASGHAITYFLGNGNRQLLLAASDAARSVATVLAGVR